MYGRKRRKWGKKVPLQRWERYGRAVGKFGAGAAGAALGFIGSNSAGMYPGWKLGQQLFKNRFKRMRYANIRSNRPGFTRSNPPNWSRPRQPITGSNPGHVFGSNPGPSKGKYRKPLPGNGRKYGKRAHVRVNKF